MYRTSQRRDATTWQNPVLTRATVEWWKMFGNHQVDEPRRMHFASIERGKTENELGRRHEGIAVDHRRKFRALASLCWWFSSHRVFVCAERKNCFYPSSSAFEAKHSRGRWDRCQWATDLFHRLVGQERQGKLLRNRSERVQFCIGTTSRSQSKSGDLSDIRHECHRVRSTERTPTDQGMERPLLTVHKRFATLQIPSVPRSFSARVHHWLSCVPIARKHSIQRRTLLLPG